MSPTTNLTTRSWYLKGLLHTIMFLYWDQSEAKLDGGTFNIHLLRLWSCILLSYASYLGRYLNYVGEPWQSSILNKFAQMPHDWVFELGERRHNDLLLDVDWYAIVNYWYIVYEERIKGNIADTSYGYEYVRRPEFPDECWNLSRHYLLSTKLTPKFKSDVDREYNRRVWRVSSYRMGNEPIVIYNYWRLETSPTWAARYQC